MDGVYVVELNLLNLLNFLSEREKKRKEKLPSRRPSIIFDLIKKKGDAGFTNVAQNNTIRLYK